MLKKWRELKIESKVSFLALLLSLIILLINEARYYYQESSAEEMATIKLNLIDLLSRNNNLDRQSIVLKYMTEHDDFVEKRKLSLSLYQLMKDKIVIYTKSTNTYELASFHSMYENKGHPLSTVKNNIVKILKKYGVLDKSKLQEHYQTEYSYELTQSQLNGALYEVLKDKIVIYNVPNKLYQLRSFEIFMEQE